MQKLEAIRQQIDKLDLKLLEIIAKRSTEIDKINKIKQAERQEAFDPNREQEILNRLHKHNKSLYNSAEIGSIYKAIFKASIMLQHRLREKVEN
ncbi:chorismate mutase [Kangiella sediminilitoris]|nr:chorismate mutase [Kangiella sediminilitoris]